MPPVALEPTIPASDRPQTYALDGAATGIGLYFSFDHIFYVWSWKEHLYFCASPSTVYFQ
jgi:hypothetical protein